MTSNPDAYLETAAALFMVGLLVAADKKPVTDVDLAEWVNQRVKEHQPTNA